MRYLRCRNLIQTFALGPDSNQVAGVDVQGSVWLWNRESISPIATVAKTNAQRIAFSFDGSEVFCWGPTHFQRWRIEVDAHLPSPLTVLCPHLKWVFPEMTYFLRARLEARREYLFASQGSDLLRMNSTTGIVERYTLPYSRISPNLVPHPDGESIAVVDPFRNELVVWKLSDLLIEEIIGDMNSTPSAAKPDLPVEPVCRFETLESFPDVGFAATGQRLLIGTARSWEIRTIPEGEQMSHVKTEDIIRAYAFSPEGRLVLAATPEREVIAYDADSGKERERFRFNVGPVSELAFAPDGLTAAACGGTKRIALWDVE